MARVLRTDVYVGGSRWRAGTTPPPGIAKKITNPRAWIEVPDDAGSTPDPAPTPPPAPAPQPTVVEPVPEQPNSGGDDQVIGEVAVDPVVADPPVGGAGSPVSPGDATVSQRLKPPPRSGKGSGLDAWQAFARINNVTVDPDAYRDDIIAAVEAAGLLTGDD